MRLATALDDEYVRMDKIMAEPRQKTSKDVKRRQKTSKDVTLPLYGKQSHRRGSMHRHAFRIPTVKRTPD